MHCSNRLTPGALTALLVGVLVALSGCGPDNLVQGLRNPFGYGVCGLILVVLDVIAIVEIINSARSTGDKLLWSLVIIVFPFIGLLAYYFFGKK
jgi:hypothetical protein